VGASWGQRWSWCSSRWGTPTLLARQGIVKSFLLGARAGPDRLLAATALTFRGFRANFLALGVLRPPTRTRPQNEPTARRYPRVKPLNLRGFQTSSSIWGQNDENAPRRGHFPDCLRDLRSHELPAPAGVNVLGEPWYRPAAKAHARTKQPPWMAVPAGLRRQVAVLRMPADAHQAGTESGYASTCSAGVSHVIPTRQHWAQMEGRAR